VAAATTSLQVRRLKALAHPIRLGMMQRLAGTPEICACDLGEAFGVSQPTVSEHLRVLREAGLVRTRRQGTSICYSAVPDAVSQLSGVVNGLRPTAAAKAA
jgi:ArsR family transcriptional regulator, arsenate/arsenite/antimonite-responsive transcriptional repressor